MEIEEQVQHVDSTCDDDDDDIKGHPLKLNPLLKCFNFEISRNVTPKNASTV
jgi:hypothetical protein